MLEEPSPHPCFPIFVLFIGFVTPLLHRIKSKVQGWQNGSVIKDLPHKPGNLSSSPGIHVKVEGVN